MERRKNKVIHGKKHLKRLVSREMLKVQNNKNMVSSHHDQPHLGTSKTLHAEVNGDINKLPENETLKNLPNFVLEGASTRHIINPNLETISSDLSVDNLVNHYESRGQEQNKTLEDNIHFWIVKHRILLNQQAINELLNILNQYMAINSPKILERFLALPRVVTLLT